MNAVNAENVGFSSTRLRRIDDAMCRLVDEGQIAGAVTLIARRGQVAHHVATGWLDREARRPMERDAIFRIASMTKIITVVAALMLFEEGRFLLDDPITDYLPEFAQTKVFVRETEQGVEVADLDRSITIRHLLTHTSGLTYDFYPEDPVSQSYVREQIFRANETLAENVARLATLPLAHQPGERWTYGVSIDVIGRLVEVIAGQPFEAFLRERVIFAPLGMNDTGFFVPTDALSRVASVYAVDESGQLRREANQDVYSTPPACSEPGGGLLSTAGDYAQFCQMLLNGGSLDGARLLGRKTVALLAANQWTADKGPFPPDWKGVLTLDGYGFGLGVRVLTDVALTGLPGSVGEFGWLGAYSTYVWIDPREELFGVSLVQRRPVNARWGWLLQVLSYQALVD